MLAVLSHPISILVAGFASGTALGRWGIPKQKEVEGFVSKDELDKIINKAVKEAVSKATKKPAGDKTTAA